MAQDALDMDVRGSRPAFFSDPDTDALMTALLETMSQLWATRDYAHALEKLLVSKGVIAPGELDAITWDASEEADNETERQAFLADAFRAIGADFQGARNRTRDIDRQQSGDSQ